MRLGEVKRYEKYKDSGVEWIGEVPEGWEVSKLKYLTKQIIDGTHSTPDYIDDGIPFLRVTDITDSQNKEINFEEVKRISVEEHQSLIQRCKPKKGDLLVSKNGTIGVPRVIDWDEEFSIFVSLCLVKVNRLLDVYYCSYFFESEVVKAQIAFGGKTNTVTNLHLDKIKEFSIPLPSIKEQQNIVSFLNKKTSEIDSLIADKEKLIELLQERRQAIISEAVTKGLDRNVKMKDSGIEWIGEVPEGWEIKRIKHIAFLKSGESITSELISQEGKYPVYGGNGLRGYTASFTHNGDYVLIGRQGALCGNINYAHGKFWASEHAVVVMPVVKLDTLWLGELLRIMNLNQYSISAAQPGLAVDKIKNLFLPFPPYQEQRAIADYIGRKISDIDFLIQQINEQIIHLVEYRQSLISEAVTGKIMV